MSFFCIIIAIVSSILCSWITANRVISRMQQNSSQSSDEVEGVENNVNVDKLLSDAKFKAYISRELSQRLEAAKSEIVDEIRYLQKLDEKEKCDEKGGVKEPEMPVETPVVPKGSEDILYASAVDEHNNTFYKVESMPVKGETIFKFTKTNNGKCEFEIYKEAYSMILHENEYLRGACDVKKNGNSKVVMAQKGVAEQTVEGKWVVKRQAIVKIV